MSSWNAEAPQDDEGRQYHVGVAPGEIAPFVLLVGDPGRVERGAALLDTVRLRRAHREYVTVTGTRGDHEVSLVGTGIGADNTEIAVQELLACRRDLTFLRVGSCGALVEDVAVGDVVVSTGAVRLESTSLGFVEEGYPAVAHHEVVLAGLTAARGLDVPVRAGLTATAAGFYGWQGRVDVPIPSRVPDLPERLGRLGVVNMEMEASTLLTLASLAGVRAGVLCTVFANRVRNEFIGPEARGPAEDRVLRVALATVDVLARMDRSAGAGPFVLPPDFDRR